MPKLVIEVTELEEAQMERCFDEMKPFSLGDVELRMGESKWILSGVSFGFAERMVADGKVEDTDGSPGE